MLLFEIFEQYEDEEEDDDFSLEEHVLKKGTTVYHGTDGDFDERFLSSPVWVSDHVDPAKYFATRNSAETPRFASYVVNQDVRLAVLDRDAFDWLEERHGTYFYGTDDADDVLRTLRRMDFDGWIIPDNYGSRQADILLSDADVLHHQETTSLKG